MMLGQLPPDFRLFPLVCEFGVMVWLILIVVWLGRGVKKLLGWCFRPRVAKRLRAVTLSVELMRWTPDDPLTVKGLLDGGILILGRPGSGKSSSSSFQLLRSIIAYPESGGLILAASPGDLAMCRRLFAGQEDRLIVFDENSGLRFDVVSFLLASGGSTKDILAAIMSVSETVDRGGSQGGGGGDNGFFAVGGKRIIECGIIVVKHATGTVKMADLMGFINSAASSLAEVHDEAFQQTLHYRYLKAAYERDKPPTENFDYELAREFWTKEFPKMADRTRSGLLATVMNTLHVFNTGTNRLLFATETNITPKVMDTGRWVFVNQPIARCGQEGAFSLGIWKFMTEWHVLRRDSSHDNPPLVIHVDEFHNTINAYDTRYLGECRKFGGCMIACSQSKASFYANMGGESAEAQVDALLNNFSIKIIHALGDIKTAEWASQLVGSSMHFNLGGSAQPQEGLLSAWLGQGGWSGSFSEQMRPVMEPRQFMHGFRTGGKENGFLCDAVVIRSGEPFASTQENFLRLAFSQE